jgi:hypothetical protein
MEKIFNVLVELSDIFPVQAEDEKEAIDKIEKWLGESCGNNPSVMNMFQNSKISIQRSENKIKK